MQAANNALWCTSHCSRAWCYCCSLMSLSLGGKHQGHKDGPCTSFLEMKATETSVKLPNTTLPPKNVTFRGNHEGLCPSPAACSRRALLSPSFPTFQFSPNFRRPLTRSGRPTSNLGCATHRAEKLLIPVSGNRDIFIRRALLKFWWPLLPCSNGLLNAPSLIFKIFIPLLFFHALHKPSLEYRL